MKTKVKGLTLIELIVTLALMAIMSAIALPPMQKFIAKQQLSSDLLKIKSIIETARNKAITNKEKIQICGIDTSHVTASNDELKCISDWGNLSVITNKNDKTELLYTEWLGDHYKLVQWSAFQRKAYLELTPNGFTNHQNGTLYLCHEQYTNFHRAVVISKTARVTIIKNSKALIEKCKQ